MTSRERVMAALCHRESDRVPVDLGGMDSTGITAIAYNRLKKYLGISGGCTRIYDPYQQVATVERVVLESIGADVLPLIAEPHVWKPAILPDVSSCEIPERWNPVQTDDGAQLVRNAEGTPIARRPARGYYFEPTNPPLRDAKTVRDVERNEEVFESFDWPFFADDTFEDLARKARHLYETTGYALMGNFAVHVFAAGQLLRGMEQFMMDLVAEESLARCIMDHLVDAFIRRFDRYHKAVGRYIQIVNVNDDLGMQDGLQISPGLYRRVVKPYHERLYRHIKEHSEFFLFLHTDGSVYDIIPDLIEIGVDILNPVQFTCRNMELDKLKREFGKDITFWGGGCDTQRVLPYGKPEQVKKHVSECIRKLAPGGGFVFCQIHNIQPDVPPENIMAMYEAVRAFSM